MSASIASLTHTEGFVQFYCPLCAATVFDDEQGMAEEFCLHVRVFVDWVLSVPASSREASATAARIKPVRIDDSSWHEYP
ncbi:MAG: hypothetical protein QOI79_3465 [Mycobacterium sp.]|jgi:hypothetical protein|nr:hypothetical protein [Mycobacterium sp.]MDT5233161.1 hypothetical protein [Mycobacterium sp.]